MAMDKFSALWLSHSSISNYLKCPRLYYLHDVYKDPKTGHKLQLTAPSLSLGTAIHEVLESLSVLPVEKRFDEPLLARFETSWEKVSGKKGGFFSADLEEATKQRGIDMLANVFSNPGPLKRLSVKIKEDLPHYFLSETEGIILCGKIDWLEYLGESDSVHIIDFKTNRTKQENTDSLQLPIYLLLVMNTQKRTVTKASYWYLSLPDGMVETTLPDPQQAHETIMKIAREIQLMRKLNKLTCKTNGCSHCEPYEKILRGEAEYVGENDFRQDIYVIPNVRTDEDDSVIL